MGRGHTTHNTQHTDIATTRLNRPNAQFSENSLRDTLPLIRESVKAIIRWEGRCGVTITAFFSIYILSTRPALYKKTPQ